jgi:hypothetical protein
MDNDVLSRYNPDIHDVDMYGHFAPKGLHSSRSIQAL